MMSFDLEVIALVALMAAFIVLLVKKWGFAEWMQIHGDRFLSKLFGCDLCMSFWAAMVVCLILACWFDDNQLFFIPMFTTPITRMLV
jgi:hypothetical protein